MDQMIIVRAILIPFVLYAPIVKADNSFHDKYINKYAYQINPPRPYDTHQTQWSSGKYQKDQLLQEQMFAINVFRYSAKEP